MKKKLILPMLICLCMSGYSQNDKKFRFGLQGSGNVGWLKPEPDAKKEYDGLKLGFSYGIMTDFILSDNGNYAFSTGLNVLTNGGRLNYPDIRFAEDSSMTTEGVESSVRYNFRYVDIPLMLKMRTNEIGFLTYYGQFGFESGVKIKSTQDRTQVKKGVEGEIKHETKNIADKVQLFRLALVIGAGIEYNLSGNTSVIMGISFNNGFTNVFRKNEKRYPVNDKGDVDLEQIQLEDGQIIHAGKQRKVVSNFLALHVGVFF